MALFTIEIALNGAIVRLPFDSRDTAVAARDKIATLMGEESAQLPVEKAALICPVFRTITGDLSSVNKERQCMWLKPGAGPICDKAGTEYCQFECPFWRTA